MKLILGTAEFDPKGYAGKPPVGKKEVVRILNLAYEAGVTTLDTAVAYNVDESLFGGFGLIRKSKELRPDHFYHYSTAEEPRVEALKASIYSLEQAKDVNEVIIPLNINNTVFKDVRAPITYIRSVFDRGRLLPEYTVKDCIGFVRRHNPQGIIVGVNTVTELEEILKAW